MSEIKEQDKTPEEKLSEVETGNLLENEFRVMIAKVILSLGKERQGTERGKKCLTKDWKK